MAGGPVKEFEWLAIGAKAVYKRGVIGASISTVKRYDKHVDCKGGIEKDGWVDALS